MGLRVVYSGAIIFDTERLRMMNNDEWKYPRSGNQTWLAGKSPN